MKAETIIEKYYSDFLNTSCVSTEEVTELTTLFDIIATELDNMGLSSSMLGRINQSDIEDILRRSGVEIMPTFDLRSDESDGSDGSDGSDMNLLSSLTARQLPGEQRSELWLQQRVKYITASVSAAAAGIMGKAARENLLLEKASNGTYRTFKGGYYTDIGNIFEEVTNSYYCHINNTQIHEYSLIPHYREEYCDIMAASTDGVSSQLVNIEIKTLPGRTPDGKVKKEYYNQTQHQMECLGLKKTDFLEAKYDEYISLDDLCAHSGPDDCRGIIAEVYNLTDSRYEYQYSPVFNHDITRLQQWINTRDTVIRGCTDRLFTRWIFWKQTAFLCTHIDYDPKWIVTMGPLLKQFDKDVKALRADSKRLNKTIRDREQRLHNKRNAGNVLFTDCML